MQNLAPSIGQYLPGISPRKPLARAAHALRQLLQQCLSVCHAAGIVLKHNARGSPGYQCKTGRQFAGPQLKPQPVNFQPRSGHGLKVRVCCQKFRHNICRAIAAVLDGLTHLTHSIGNGGAVCLIIKPDAQGYGIDVKPGGTKFVLRFAQAHGHAQQQFTAPKAAAKGAPRQSHKTGQHTGTRIFSQNLKALSGFRIYINAGHGPGTAGSPCSLIDLLYRGLKHRPPVGGIPRAGWRSGIGCLPAAKALLCCQSALHKWLAPQMTQGVLQQYFKCFAIARHMVHQHQHLHTVGQSGRHQPHRQLCAQLKGRVYLLVKKGCGLVLVGKGHAAQMHLALGALKMGIIYIARHCAAKKLLRVGSPAQTLKKICRFMAPQFKQQGHIVVYGTLVDLLVGPDAELPHAQGRGFYGRAGRLYPAVFEQRFHIKQGFAAYKTAKGNIHIKGLTNGMQQRHGIEAVAALIKKALCRVVTAAKHALKNTYKARIHLSSRAVSSIALPGHVLQCLTVNLARGRRRHGLKHMPSRGNHVGRQAVPAPRNHRLYGCPRLKYKKCGKAGLTASILNRQHGRLTNGFAVFEQAGHLGQFHAVAANFHLIVCPAQKHYFALC